MENNKLRTLDSYEIDENDNLKKVIEFFQINNIYHIRWSGKTIKKQICVHELFHYAECDCERCNLERLNLVRTKELLNVENSSRNYEYLRRGYTHYLLGNYKESYEIFYKVYTEANKNQNPINFTISKYNLIKLRGLIKSFYYENDRDEIVKKLEKIKFENDERFVKEYAPYFVDIYKNIKDLKFYDNVFDKIDDSFLKIQKFHYRDRHGGSESDAAYYKLQSSFLRFKSYLHHNFIIFNHYQEYEQLSQKILESLLVLHTLKNPETNKYEQFDWYALELWIFNIQEEFTTYLFRKYEIKTIRISMETFNKLEALVDNLLKSQIEFKKYSSVYSPLRLGRIINNIIAIITLVDKTPQQKENIILKILSNSKILLKYNLMPFDGLNFYAIKKESFIKKATLKKIAYILFLNNSTYRYFEVLEKYFELCTEKEIEKLIYRVLKINTLDDINVKSVDFEDLLYAFSLLNQNNKDSLKVKFNNILEKDFDSSLYSNLLLYDLIDFEESSFDKLLSYVVNRSDFDEKRFPFHSYQNLDFYNVMSVVFKYNLKIDEKIKAQIDKVFHKERDYFEWLMDIDNYDYTKFNSYWILKSRTKYFTERFKKSTKLKTEIEKSLKVNYIEGVAKMYFRDLV
ncbi:hypothetical protein OF897_04295 [Chryseobacterium formosus]|uniref:Uncharacterized protein n=1 Tax=Chryseobacterium formosus TaxID=1537363 RepID=A0ABT3XNS5_9FLAO|nr:hypothetical protein [Chryseobacterium formosus]MCX8523142.1 hypothetical protein [Chryseobacterium formosus]